MRLILLATFALTILNTVLLWRLKNSPLSPGDQNAVDNIYRQAEEQRQQMAETLKTKTEKEGGEK